MPDPIEELAPLVGQRRAELKLSLREASRASGVPVATLSRIEQGRMPDLDTFRKLVAWLGLPPERFFAETQRAENTPEMIAEHLRADPALPADAAEMIAGVMRDMYTTLASQERRLTVHLRAAKTFTPAALGLLTDLLDDMQLALEQRYEL